MVTKFLRELVAYWRDPKDKWIKVAVYVGLIAHITVLISVETGWWNEFFTRTTHNKFIQASDFFAIYIAGHDLLQGHTIYSSMASNSHYSEIVPYFFPFRYLPVCAWVGVALNIFKPWQAYFFWIILSEILFLVSIVMLCHHFKSMRQIHIILAMYLLFVPLYCELYIGQFNLLQSFLILGMILSASGGFWNRTQAWWIVSVLWKMNTILCIPALLRWGKWKPLLWLILVVVITCGPYFLFHPEDVCKFLFTNIQIPGRPDLEELGVDFSFAHIGTVTNVSVQSLLASATMHHDFESGVVFNTKLHLWSWLVFFLIAILATVFAKNDRFVESLCLWIMMYFMVYTNVWENHYLMLLPIVTFLYLKHSSIWLLISWFLLAIPPRHLGYSQLLPNWDIAFIRPISALILFGICIYLMVWKTDKVKVKETSVHMDPDPEPLTVN